MFPLDELEEGDHVGAAEVVGRLQAREEAPPRQSLEVVLADVLKQPMKKVSQNATRNAESSL